MSLSLAITINALADVALLGGLAYLMSQTRRLTPDVARADAPAATAAPAQRPVRQAPRFSSALQPAPSSHASGLTS